MWRSRECSAFEFQVNLLIWRSDTQIEERFNTRPPATR